MADQIHEPKLFTVEEANRLLTVLTPILQEMSRTKRHLEAKQVEIDALELIADENTPKVRTELFERSEEFNQLVTEFNQLIARIEDRGCLVKDPDKGLVDFYGMHEGRVVFYCWRLGEPQVGYWHEIGSGYANRKPLADPLLS